jgi:D-beta-D-heptose 7-phosphate kinase/D-beta-D-heptose 1-phosphate adenosyltransferase
MKITVIGEFCTDIFVYGETKRLSPEAPVPVFNPLYVERNFGMAGNVVENLKSLDQDVTIKHLHQFQPIKKTRYVDDKSNHMFIRIDEGEETITPLELTDSVIDEIKESDAVIISDYNKGYLNEKILLEVAYYSRFIVMDTKKQISPNLVSNFNFIKLNEHEYSNFSDDIKKQYPNKLIVTLGSKGAKYMDTIYPSPDPRETIDVSGAGDTFTASFTVKYLETKNIEESIIYANEMSSIVVQKRGVSVPITKQKK